MVAVWLLLLLFVRVLNALPDIDRRHCKEYADDCLNKKPYVIRQFGDESVMTWNEARELCFNPNDDEVDGMATLDISSQSLTSLDEQFDLLRSVCGVLQNADGRNVNCWVGGKLNENATGYIFDSMDTNRASYSPQLADASRWGCVRNSDGSCKKDIEGINLDNGEDYITLFQNRNYYFADWPQNGGINEDFQTTAVVCNNAKFSHYDVCQCSCASCDIYGDPHVHTFDGLAFHTRKYCAYYAVTPCTLNTFLPFEISTENVECFYGFSSCLQSVYVSLYDPISFELHSVIKFHHHQQNNNLIKTVITYLDDDDTFVPMDVQQTWSSNNYSYVLTKNEETNYFNFGIWINSKYESVNIEFYDLSSLNSLHLSSLRITLSSCFVKTSCGICGYFDNNQSTELMVRDPLNETSLINFQLTDDEYFVKNLSNPFNEQMAELISGYSHFWIDDNRSSNDDDCDDDDDIFDFDLCQLHYCNDECLCNDDDSNPISYNGVKQIQCNYDLAACLGLTADSIECSQLQQNNDLSVIEQYIMDNAPDCARIVDLYCCFYPFCQDKASYCDISESPTQNPTNGPTREPTDKPTESPSSAPTNGPTKMPITESPSINPTESPTNSPFINTMSPTSSPTIQPTDMTLSPTAFPTLNPTESPTDSPSSRPTDFPTLQPSNAPTESPTFRPSDEPTPIPSGNPTSSPSKSPTFNPTPEPTRKPTNPLTNSPTLIPTQSPTNAPTLKPTKSPIIIKPSTDPTNEPSESPNKLPTLQPSPVWPTLSPRPTNPFCKLTRDLDMMFVVHSKCTFNQETCQHKRQFVADLIQSVNIGQNPRIGFIECSNVFIEYGIKLTDNSLNDINENNELSQQNRNELYLNKIETRLQCADGNNVSTQQCIDKAIEIFESDKSDNERIRKIVYLQICQNEDEDGCDLKERMKHYDVELILLNIGGNGHECLYNYDDFEAAKGEMFELVGDICETADSYSESSEDSIVTVWPSPKPIDTDSNSEESESQSDESSDDDSSVVQIRHKRKYVRHYSTNSDDSE